MSEKESLSVLMERIDERFPVRYENPISSLKNKRKIQLALYGFAVAFFAYHLWYAFTVGIPRAQHGLVHLGFIFLLWTLVQVRDLYMTERRGKFLTVAYGIYGIISITPIIYTYTNFRELILFRAGVYTDIDLLMGAVVTLCLLIAVWTVSRLIFAVASFGLIYAYFGEYMPGLLQHGGLSIDRVISMNTMEMQGIFGNLTQISATWIVIFIMLAGLIEMYGGMRTFIKGITRVVARYRYLEIGYVAVLSSMIFGSINGAATANSATTGAFTIPMMKENRYPPRFAAAIEAVASSGGQILPPVMGSSAFLMAELIDPSYPTIVFSSVAPALLLYMSIIICIGLYVNKNEITKMDFDVSSAGSYRNRFLSIIENYDFIIAIAVLLYWLLYVQASPLKSGFYAIIVLMIFRLIRMIHTGYKTGNIAEEGAQYLRQSLEGFLRGAETMVNITIMIAALGLVVRAFVVTGLAQNLSAFLVELSGGNPIALVLLAAIASIVFGMGMPTLAAYLLVALFVAPSMSSVFDVNLLSIHLFVFYYAIVSNITPPIAIAVVITQGIADADFFDAAIDSMKIGFSMFIIPFVFIFQPSILNFDQVLVTSLIVLAGLALIAVGIIGFRGDSILSRSIATFGGAIMIFGPTSAQAVVLLLAAGGVVYIYRQRQAHPA